MEALDLLPEEMQQRSLSDREVVLPYDDALRAIEIFLNAEWALLGWEGWIQSSQGIGHHVNYQGTVSIEQRHGETWSEYVRRAAAFCRATIRQDQQRWETAPDSADKQLVYCLTVTAPQVS